MKKPILVIMAAGMGSRYGGLKQIDPVGPNGEVIIDYSLYDARRAGFETVIFIIKHEIEEAFRAAIGDRISRYMNVKYAFQQLDDLPEGYAVPEGRQKPWGTAHAVLSARDLIDAPFAVINADDYYGPEAYQIMYDYLSTHQDGDRYEYAMVGYLLKNTTTEHGHVARGVCETNAKGYLTRVTERTRIEEYPGGIHFSTDEGATWTDLNPDTIVSMNLWGFTQSFVTEAKARFSKFLDKTLTENPAKGEYFLPTVVSQLLDEGKARCYVLSSRDKWYGVTYQADKPEVMEALAQKVQEGVYPSPLWSEQA
ncbi:MAG: nucleotidyltransferase [Oscillospiraceae bacterium]|nr:nucleotidyltransferase [Oscillospiraceae bacterium]